MQKQFNTVIDRVTIPLTNGAQKKTHRYLCTKVPVTVVYDDHVGYDEILWVDVLCKVEDLLSREDIESVVENHSDIRMVLKTTISKSDELVNELYGIEGL